MQTTAQDTVARTGLRPLGKVEEGTAFSQLPAGVFGFTYAPLSESPLFSARNYHSFEMQKLANGSGRLIVWVTPTEAAQIRSGDGFAEVYVYPDNYNDASEAIGLPLDRVRSRNRNPVREDGNRLLVTIYPQES